MLLAELEVWHSRPVTPTRRISLGNIILPVEPTPGFGGLLLGAVVAAHLGDVDDDLVADVHRLLGQVAEGQRVVQPRLRHRYQVDRHGLGVSRHRMQGEGENVHFSFDTNGSGLVQILGAIYAIERLDLAARRALVPVMHKAMRWRGPVGPSFISHLAGTSTASLAAMADPRAWAFELFGFPLGTTTVTKKEVMARYRDQLRVVHPDHGGDELDAGKAIIDLGEARRILLA
ncbi:unannotated protein [freshwater metagenome]|uniref:Unannotated protein n=1 Tax=freshwater metagenome TaxID=449393 RepID=A0A6J7EM70_9ZZZZ|nr:hypothetical protein [Actinomycetota bacterium]